MKADRGVNAIAYDVSVSKRVRAVLFVADPLPSVTLPGAPPSAPQFSSGGRVVAAWVAGNKLCMLVVDGDERAYRAIIRAGQSPLA